MVHDNSSWARPCHLDILEYIKHSTHLLKHPHGSCIKGAEPLYETQGHDDSVVLHEGEHQFRSFAIMA